MFHILALNEHLIHIWCHVNIYIDLLLLLFYISTVHECNIGISFFFLNEQIWVEKVERIELFIPPCLACCSWCIGYEAMCMMNMQHIVKTKIQLYMLNKFD